MTFKRWAFLISPIITNIGRENKSSADVYMCIRRGDLRSSAGEHTSPLPCSENITRRSRHHTRSAHHVPRAEHIVPNFTMIFILKTRKNHLLLLIFFTTKFKYKINTINKIAASNDTTCCAYTFNPKKLFPFF